MKEIPDLNRYFISEDLIDALFDSPEMLQEKVITSVS